MGNLKPHQHHKCVIFFSWSVCNLCLLKRRMKFSRHEGDTTTMRITCIIRLQATNFFRVLDLKYFILFDGLTSEVDMGVKSGRSFSWYAVSVFGERLRCKLATLRLIMQTIRVWSFSSESQKWHLSFVWLNLILSAESIFLDWSSTILHRGRQHDRVNIEMPLNPAISFVAQYEHRPVLRLLFSKNSLSTVQRVIM